MGETPVPPTNVVSAPTSEQSVEYNRGIGCWMGVGMSGTLGGLLLRSWAQQRKYAGRLVADLSDEDMIRQPIAGVVMNHPAWIIGHLSAYPPALSAMLRGQKPNDPKDHSYGRGTTPAGDVSAYPPKAEHVTTYFRLHDELATTLESPEATGRLGDQIGVPRWRERFPTVAHACVYLMTTHEATHLGQLSAWRRACDMPAV